MMRSETIKDVREWGTFVLSLIAAICIPIAVIVMKNLRLEIERETAATYVSKTEFNSYQESQRTALQSQNQISSATSIKFEVKLDAVSTKMDALTIQQAIMQEQLKQLSQKRP